MKIKKFEDIISWQKAKVLSLDMHKIFKNIRDFTFKDQIQRASISIMNNIAEGYERMGNKEFIKFLYIAKGSCGEVRSMLYVALSLNYLDEDNFNRLYNLSIETSRLVSGLIKTL